MCDLAMHGARLRADPNRCANPPGADNEPVGSHRFTRHKRKTATTTGVLHVAIGAAGVAHGGVAHGHDRRILPPA
jgi:hypothetical protein